MNLKATVMKLIRRWYILLPGLLLAVGAAFGMWLVVPPQYERTSTQVLLPGKASLPAESENPYLYLGGLSLAADVVVRATGSVNMVTELAEQHPGVAFQVGRDPSTSGPVIRTTVLAASDDEAGVVLGRLTEYSVAVIGELQDKENIPQAERITVVTVTLDEQGITSNRTRLILTGGAGFAIAGVTVLLAALVEGIASWRRSKQRTDATGSHTEGLGPLRRDEPPPIATTNVVDASSEETTFEEGLSPDLEVDVVDASPEETTVEEELSPDLEVGVVDASPEETTVEEELSPDLEVDVVDASPGATLIEQEQSEVSISLVDSQQTR